MGRWTNAQRQARWRKRRDKELKQLRAENKRLKKQLGIKEATEVKSPRKQQGGAPAL
jgi:cell shape-determining protein MreC